MSSRDKIMTAIKANQPALLQLPDVQMERQLPEPSAILPQFVKTLESIGGKAVVINDVAGIRDTLEQSRNGQQYIVNTLPYLGTVNTEVISGMHAGSLEPVFTAYIEATLGVAENGSVWLYEHQLKNRLLPFICQHLVICLHAHTIVPTMHEAYEKIDIAREGYGVFLAGPSKTADIEQSLVIGAHGARSLLVYLITG